MSDFRVHILGCGSALPTTRHYPSAQGVAYREKVFISHLHGDHCYGLPGLLSTLSLLGRRRALPIYGPRGIADYLAPFISSSTSWLGYEIEVHTLHDRQAGSVHEDRSVSVGWSDISTGPPATSTAYPSAPSRPYVREPTTRRPRGSSSPTHG